MRRSNRDPASRPLRVLVAHRHEATRVGLRLMLEAEGFEVCAECANATETLARASEERFDACLIDVGLPGGGAATAAALAQRADAPKAVMLAASPEPADLFEALGAGARGYLLHDVEGEDLAHALRAVAAGFAVVGAGLTTELVEDVRATRRLAARQLSGREREVLALLGEGLTTRRVAVRLGIAPPTVRRHVSSALRKLGVADRRAAVALLGGVHCPDERK
jgi:two-component system response regulator DevR